MQLDQNQMGELLRILNGVDCFYLANDPKKLLWKEGGLVGVSEWIEITKSDPQDDKGN